MSLTRAARRPNSSASSSGRPNSLTRVAPGAEKRSVICDVMAALCPAASRSRCPTRAPTRRAGITKTGSRTMASRVIEPRQAGHHDDGQHQGDDVGDDPRQGRGERPLGADDVVVQAAHQRTGVGPGEEGDGHALHVLEHLLAEVEDQALAEAGRLEAAEEADDRAGHGDGGDEQGQAHDRGRGAVVHDGVDGLTGEDRDGDAEHGPDGGQEEEGHDRPAVGAGEHQDAAQACALEKRAWVPSSCIALRSAVHAFMSTGRHAKASISL